MGRSGVEWVHTATTRSVTCAEETTWMCVCVLEMKLRTEGMRAQAASNTLTSALTPPPRCCPYCAALPLPACVPATRAAMSGGRLRSGASAAMGRLSRFSTSCAWWGSMEQLAAADSTWQEVAVGQGRIAVCVIAVCAADRGCCMVSRPLLIWQTSPLLTCQGAQLPAVCPLKTLPQPGLHRSTSIHPSPSAAAARHTKWSAPPARWCACSGHLAAARA